MNITLFDDIYENCIDVFAYSIVPEFLPSIVRQFEQLVHQVEGTL